MRTWRVWRAFFAGCPVPSVVARRGDPKDAQAFLSRLKASEREIHDDVLAPDRREHNTFWKLYFGLFPLRGDPEAAKQSLRTAP